jgi:DNA-binding NarL/FixJ family response regulator
MFKLALVDDDADARLLVAHALKSSENFQIVGEAASGDDAVTLVSSRHPDIVLLDPAVSGGDGVWILPRIRKAAPSARVVLHSSFPASELRFAALSGGAVGYLERSRSPLTIGADLLAVCGLLDVVEAGINEAKARLGVHLQTPRLARRFVKDALSERGAKSEIELVELLVSELVTNAVIHARSEVEVSVSISLDVVRIAVFDSSREAPVRRPADGDGESGRGLLMLEALSTAWGIEFAPGGKNVWFEVRNEFPTTV